MNVVIGGTGIEILTTSPAFENVLRDQYAGFIEPGSPNAITLTVDLTPPVSLDPDADIEVRNDGGLWLMERGDFHASYDATNRCGFVRQSASRYSLDSVLRIIHSLTLAGHDGFLLHAASAVRSSHAFIFSGQSGAGKTTISGLAPADVHLLTDEVSYIRKCAGCWTAWGTPFAGELARAGENRSAPVKALFLLRHGAENRITPLRAPATVRSILRNVLFFAEDSVLTESLFDTVCDFAASVPVFELLFLPDARVWSLIQ
jgi:hypothetical protein